MKLQFLTERDIPKRPHASTKQMALPKEPLLNCLRAAFDIMQHELKLDKDTRTVAFAFFDKLDEANGETLNNETDPFRVNLIIEAPFDVIATMSHEMHHVRDLANGDLKYDTDNDEMFYKGQKVNTSAAVMAGLDHVVFPWESDAYEHMYQLAIKVVEQLPPEQQAYINRMYELGKQPPTLIEYYQKNDRKYNTIQAKAERSFVEARATFPAMNAMKTINDVF